MKATLACVTVWWLVSCGAASAEGLSANAIYEKTLHSTCWVRLPRSFGSGSVVDKEKRLILTSCHVVQTAATVTVWFPVYEKGKVVVDRGQLERTGHPVHGKVLAREQARDLALIQVDSIPADVTEIKIAEKSASPGDRVHSVGNGQKNGVMFGYHSGYVRQICPHSDSYSGVTINCRVLETQAPHNPGDSGGPTVNDQGEQVGVTAAYTVQAQSISFHIDVSEIREFLKKYR